MSKPMFAPHSVLVAALLALTSGTAALAQAVPLTVPAPVDAPAGVVAPVAPPTVKTAELTSADKANEVICRRQTETGSLVKVKKTCHTRSQWQYIQQENKRMATEMVLNNSGRPSGN